MTRIFHSCDFHGSEPVWRKAIRAASDYKPDIVMVCGDLTGKAIAPIVERSSTEWYCAPGGRQEILHSMAEVQRKMTEFRNKGYYTYLTTRAEIDELKSKPDKVKTLFTALMKETLQKWVGMAEAGLPRGTKLIVNPGNDDPYEIDDVVKNDALVIYPLGKVVQLDDRHQLISCEWVNKTPWNTPRECSEDELTKKLEHEFSKTEGNVDVICNFHAPPFDTPIDLAPKLDKNLKVAMQGLSPIMEHVGSKAVRESIETHQPRLSLHGHIHESYGFIDIGRTLCVNPGSEYQAGILRGYVIDVPRERDGKIEFTRVEQ